MVHSYNIFGFSVFPFCFVKIIQKQTERSDSFEFLFLTGNLLLIASKIWIGALRWFAGWMVWMVWDIIQMVYGYICLAAPLIACQGHKLSPTPSSQKKIKIKIYTVRAH